MPQLLMQLDTNKVLLIIMDGVGTASNNKGNAVTLANPQNLIKYWDSYPHTYLKASSESVGLPPKTNGNSEVGHLNIGAGKVVLQNLPKINRSIEKGLFFSNQILQQAVDHANSHNSKIHIMGCLSDGSVHAHINHFLATLDYLARRNHKGKVYIHAFTDGRDTPPDSGRKFLTQISQHTSKVGIGNIASICGRAFAMDRNKKWERTEKTYKMLVEGSVNTYERWEEAIDLAYSENKSDEYIEPVLILDNGEKPVIKDNDVVLFLNFRADRAIQLSQAFIEKEFNHFQVNRFENLFFSGMVEYRKEFPEKVLFPKEYLTLSLGRILSESGLRQLRISESEKFPHVTYFFNGGIAIKYPGEDRIEVPSPNVPTYDLQPEMSAHQVLEVLLRRIELNIYSFIVLNIPNGDMVGHTGNLEACIKAMQVVDYMVEKLVNKFLAYKGTVIITADHGNVEEVIKLETNEIDTEHSLNPVPFIIVNQKLKKQNLPFGSLADITPTILDLMNVSRPAEVTGKSLVKGLI